MCVLPGLMGFDLGLGEGLDGDGEEVIGVVSGCKIGKPNRIRILNAFRIPAPSALFCCFSFTQCTMDDSSNGRVVALYLADTRCHQSKK